MKTLLKVSAVVMALFVLTPMAYGTGEILIEAWRDMLPYSWTHGTSGCSHRGHHHRY